MNATSNTFQSRRRIAQNYSLVWVDGTIDRSEEEWKNNIAVVQTIISDINTFIKPDECVPFLNAVSTEKILVITSGFLGEILVQDIHHLPSVYAIYILCGNEARHKAWTKSWSKIQGVFTSIKDIRDSLKRVAHKIDHNEISMTIVSKQNMTETTSGQRNLDQLEPSYMYSVIFKEIILEIHEDDSKSLNKLIEYCQQQKVNESQLKYFQREYHKKSSIWWYTEPIFLYGMLNKALRTLDMECMIKMAFFMRKLHKEIEQLCCEQSDEYTAVFPVYRGQGFSQRDFRNLFNAQESLLSFNCFLSTSKKRKVAMDFVQDALDQNTNNVGAIFIMTIDPSKISTSKTPFAMIDDQSAVRGEQEILFTMHTVFRVGEIKQTAENSRLWEVQLTITDDNDPQLSTLTNRIKEEIDGRGWHRMGRLMLRVGHFNQAEELYQELLKNASTDSERVSIDHQLGYLKHQQGKYPEAVKFYEKSLKIYEISLPPNHPNLATSYNNIGEVYRSMGEYSKALDLMLFQSYFALKRWS
ncbi:unnamed protein product [Rotaria magnacalcarata]|uniref:Uncharacterized protein n=1 Tax=Rotaria magnacalcarata TaxID=392030 RepID=A0A816XH08_9BILA|nr:unnamed protein product [Rotaria magnacalcarata]CAF4292694.1 unnamed protein product [Rotaria magnacalcarata]